MMFFIKKISLPLQCVFHSIRFKVNKVGVQRYSFFYVLWSTGMGEYDSSFCILRLHLS